MRKYDLPSTEDQEWLDEVEETPNKVLKFLSIFMLSAVVLYYLYTLIGGWALTILLLILGSITWIVFRVRKGILTTRKNNGNRRK